MDYQDVCNDDELLIKFVRSHGNIFDKNNKHFRNKTARAKAWEAIAHKLGKKPEECRQRWVILRHKYVGEKRKMREDASIKESSWPLFDSMGFLDNFILPRRSWNLKRTDRVAYDESTSQTMVPDNAEDRISLQVDEIEIKNEKVECDLPSTSATTKPPTFDPLQGDANFVKVKKSEDQVTSSVATALEELRKCLESAQAKRHEASDSDFSFGKTVTLHLKDIKDAKRKRRVKLQIMKILLGEDSDDENRSSDK